VALFTTTETDALLADAPGVVVTYGSPTQTTNGYFDKESAAINAAGGIEVIGGQLGVWIRDGSLTSLTQDSTITVDGTSYTIHDIGKASTDGLRRIALVET
jgi:hypothetical protein